MKFFLLFVFLAAGAILIVSATLFRSQRAATMLRFLRRLGWAYVIAVLTMGVYYMLQGGL